MIFKSCWNWFKSCMNNLISKCRWYCKNTGHTPSAVIVPTPGMDSSHRILWNVFWLLMKWNQNLKVDIGLPNSRGQTEDIFWKIETSWLFCNHYSSFLFFQVILVLFLPLQRPNHTFSGDGHDKLMDFAKDTFPLAVYGMQDVFSGYLVYLKVWMSNSNPKLVGRWYLEHLYKSKGNALCFDNNSTMIILLIACLC